jgi:hypothetical protein
MARKFLHIGNCGLRVGGLHLTDSALDDLTISATSYFGLPKPSDVSTEYLR